MAAATSELDSVVTQALEDQSAFDELVEGLSQASRKQRQSSANALKSIALSHPEKLEGAIDDIVDALNRPEAQTRWACLDALAALVPHYPAACEAGIVGAETAVFDEDSGLVRLSAVRFLCVLGATSKDRSRMVWPLIDEVLQCYHGDSEFQDMLVAVIGFSQASLAPEVKTALADRVRFDAESGKGSLKRKAQQIIDNVS